MRSAGGAAFLGRRPVHCWLDPPLQVQMITVVPLAVAAPVTSRHRPDWPFVMVPLLFDVHFWPLPPVQFAITAAVPAAVPPAAVSRHRCEPPE